MSRAIELAVKLGMLAYADQGAASCVWTPGCNGTSQSDLEAFYHAARAEALREAMNECAAQLVRLSKMPDEKWPDVQIAIAEIGHTIRAMADREGK